MNSTPHSWNMYVCISLPPQVQSLPPRAHTDRGTPPTTTLHIPMTMMMMLFLTPRTGKRGKVCICCVYYIYYIYSLDKRDLAAPGILIFYVHGVVVCAYTAHPQLTLPLRFIHPLHHNHHHRHIAPPPNPLQLYVRTILLENSICNN